MDADEVPHLIALRQARDAGFVFVASEVQIQGARRWAGAEDRLFAVDMRTAVGERYRLSDQDDPRAQPIWRQHGPVAEVVAHLLDLPAHGSPGAPRTPLPRYPRSSSGWSRARSGLLIPEER